MAQKTSLDDFQAFLDRVYSINNGRNYSNADLISYLHRHITQILKAVRKEKHDQIPYRLCMAFSWGCSIANRWHIKLPDEIWKRFPGVCPYCGAMPCFCKERGLNRQLPTQASTPRPFYMSDWQKMFSEIYPKNTINDSAVHLAEEIGELSEAIRNHWSIHNEEWFDKSIEELVDTIANLFGVASCLKFDLEDNLEQYFKNGCPKCHTLNCHCGYVIIDEAVKP